MSKESKERWRVRTWDVPRELSGAVAKQREAEALETELNALAKDGYDIHDVDLDEKLIVGRYDDELQQAKESQEEKERNGLLEGLLRMLPIPASAPDSPEEKNDFPPMVGSHSAELMYHLMGLMRAAGVLPESILSTRIESLISHFGKRIGPEELLKSFDDIRKYHTHHSEHCSGGCATDKVYTLAEKSIQAHLASNPSN